MEQANLIEIFESLQGEGPYVGEPMVFVRFQDCALSCQFCDTPDSFKKHSQFRIERRRGSGEFEWLENPISHTALNECLRPYPSKTLSLTGGEPLQHADFLKSWLPSLAGEYRILLETNGTLSDSLQKVLEWVDIISMDFKLPSATGMAPLWEEHRAFLKLASQKDVYLKAVVAGPTRVEEIEHAIALVRELAPGAPFILQPVTPHGPIRETIDKRHLQELYELSKRQLEDVRIIPQMHVEWGIL